MKVFSEKLFSWRAVFTQPVPTSTVFLTVSRGEGCLWQNWDLLGGPGLQPGRRKACSKAVLLSQLQETCNKVHEKTKRKCSQRVSLLFSLLRQWLLPLYTRLYSITISFPWVRISLAFWILSVEAVRQYLSKQNLFQGTISHHYNAF